jgi:hypothetical protein
MRKQEEHERFLDLSARAEVSDLSESEFREWQAHLRDCEACRSEAKRLKNLFWNASIAGDIDHEAASEFPESFELNDERSGETDLMQRLRGTTASQPSHRTKELLPISISLDLPVGESPRDNAAERRRMPSRLAVTFGAIAAIALLMVGGVGYRLSRERSLNRNQALEIARLGAHMNDLEGQVSTLGSQRSDSMAGVESELSAKGVENAKLAKRTADLEQQLKEASGQIHSLIDQLAAEQGSKSDLAIRLQQEQAIVAQMRSELELARSRSAQDALAQGAKDAQIADLENGLTAASEAIDRDRRLLTADRDIRDLMGARNLHIIDVLDVNGDGKTQKSFGRAFYTQGKSLVFYAFDLGSDKKHKGATDVAFQVWGTHSWDRQAAQNLGIFYQDDKSTNRWVLKFSDPNVLAEIDSVFVTLEPPGGSKKPTGREILSAYLNSKINHP